MELSQFNYQLPSELIAQYPLTERTASRLLCVDGEDGRYTDKYFADLPELLHPGDLLVFNNTRVIPARLNGYKDSGGRVEVLVERILDSHRALAHVRASKSPQKGRKLLLENAVEAIVTGRQDDLFELEFISTHDVITLLQKYGHIPLPPYIERDDEQDDQERYQTVYARQDGAVAAPTAGLHFSEEMLKELEQRGIQQKYITLHVGAGTFQPVREKHIEQHHMHAERFEVSEAVCRAVNETKNHGGRVIAVGTTVVRALESATRNGELESCSGETDIFIYPGFEFKIVDAMLTNFHLPQSTLLMLVCAFSGYDAVMHAYNHAVEERYRFFSYGDAMFLTR